MTLEETAEDLASSLGVDKSEVLEDLETLVSYSVPLDEATQSIRRKYGDIEEGYDPADIPTLDVADITSETENVTVTVRVLTLGTRSIRYNGEDQVIFEGEVADTTGKIPYTAWNEFGFEPGDTITVTNAGVREWEGVPQLNFGDGTQITVEENQLDVSYQVGGQQDLIDITPGSGGISVSVYILECEERVIDGRDGETPILSGVLADETAQAPFTDWEPHEDIEEGTFVQIENVHIREYRGVPSVNLSEFSEIEPIKPFEYEDTAVELSLYEAIDAGGIFDVKVTGNIIDIRDGSGLIQRCPDCNRVVVNDQCREHGAVDSYDDLRIKAILDDGTDTVTAIFDRELTEEIYGKSLEEALEEAQEAMDRDVISEHISSTMIGRELTLRGSLSVDEYGANITVRSYSDPAERTADRARKFLAEVSQ